MLTDLQCKAATCSAGKKHTRYADSGGMYLEVAASGSKRWFLKYRTEGKEKKLALGSYPAVSLTAARRARDAAKVQRSAGIDPIQARRSAKLRQSVDHASSFKAVAESWLKKRVDQWSPAHLERCRRQLERDFYPWLGARPIAQIDRAELLGVLQRVEHRGALETADRGLMLCRQIWRYAIAADLAPGDVTVALKDALTPYRGKHLAAITDPNEFADLLRAIRAYRGGPVVRGALQLAPLVFQRPGELRAAAWSEIDLDAAVWTIPAQRMKRDKTGKEQGDPHIVPLSRQAVEILRGLLPLTGHRELVFPGERGQGRPISENSVRTALISMGYTPERHTWHGFRASARTMLAERLEVDPLVIEAQLAHAVKDANGRAYNRTQYLAQRAEMMQRWADYLDQLVAAKVSRGDIPTQITGETGEKSMRQRESREIQTGEEQGKNRGKTGEEYVESIHLFM